jgi:hypothetical protein
LLLAAGHGAQLPNELDDSRTNRDENNRRQDKDHKRGNHLNRGFGCLLFGALPAFRAEGVGMHAEGLGHAGAEAVCLNQCTNQRADIVNACSLHQIPESLGAGLASSHLEVHEMEFIAEIGVGMVKILTDAHERLIEGESGLNADYGKVESIG